MDRTDEYEPFYEEIVGDLGRYSDRAETEEAHRRCQFKSPLYLIKEI